MSLINPQWNKISTELIQDPNNIELWKRLIHASETTDTHNKPLTKSSSTAQLTLLRTSYESFLRKFPHEATYWTKYALWEFHLGRTSQAIAVFERGVACLPWCIDLWMAYLKFRKETVSNDVDSVLGLFERARKHVGFHFYAREFYEMYLGFLECYATAENGFERKTWVLVRLVLEVPLFDYGVFYKKWFDLIEKLAGDEELARKKLGYVIPEWKGTEGRIEKKVFAELKKRFTDAYISTQFHTYELYNFEKRLVTKNQAMSAQDMLAWMSYIEYLEVKQYPRKFIELVYYRWMYKEPSNEEIWMKLADFYIFHDLFNQARKALSDALKFVNNDYKVLIKLVDLEIYLKNYQRGVNLLVGYLQFNANAPLPIQEKVMQVKKLIE
ncbi:U1 small nuclear ribonucleoprotein component PRP42 [Candida viswanathii]|uniref:U1 small nuclear ribonucleoprotein component PRP42 n=1 Tax=Candida viswanathii TaxID=5486 RepID=A0A367Y9U6_9ASCO|nr:U1 small nuclear ribonucleoprotein component PRP42 [Candida viswanathii]